jgi:hypothetical protein
MLSVAGSVTEIVAVERPKLYLRIFVFAYYYITGLTTAEYAFDSWQLQGICCSAKLSGHAFGHIQAEEMDNWRDFVKTVLNRGFT